MYMDRTEIVCMTYLDITFVIKVNDITQRNHPGSHVCSLWPFVTEIKQNFEGWRHWRLEMLVAQSTNPSELAITA